MKHNFKLSIYEADSMFYEGLCESCVIPTIDGQYGIMANHVNMISAVVPGVISFRTVDDGLRHCAVSAGMIKVENNEVLVLVDSAERPEEIDINRAKRQADAAKEELLQKKSLIEFRAAEATLARAMNRLKVSYRFTK